MKKLLAFRHVAFEDLGTFAEFFRLAGFEIRYVDTATAALADINPLEADLLVVLGGPMGVYEEREYPFLQQEITMLRSRIAQRRPTLGICLGAQLIAKALGARVYPGITQEIGWAPVRLTTEGRHGALAPLGGAEGPPPAVLHWHGDTFDLPVGATLLASTATYAHQAFAVGRHVLALQFHLEVQPYAISAWIDANAALLATAGIAPVALQTGENLVSKHVAHGVLGAWLAQLPEPDQRQAATPGKHDSHTRVAHSIADP